MLCGSAVKPRSLDCNLTALLVCVIYLQAGSCQNCESFCRQSCPARAVGPQPSASSSSGRILVKLLLKSSLGKSIWSPFQTLSGLGRGWDLMYVHCGHFKENTTLHAHTHTEKETDTGKIRRRITFLGLPPEITIVNMVVSCFPQVYECISYITEVKLYKQFFLMLV